MRTVKEDALVIRRIREGMIDEFETLVRAYAPGIRAYVSSRLYDREYADDIVQEVFIRFYGAIGRFDIRKPVVPYLLEITKNALKMYYRSHKQTVSLSDAMQFRKEEGGEIAATDIGDMTRELPPAQKKAIIYVAEGYSYREIASKLQKPINTVRTLIRRARLQLIKRHNETT